MRIVLIVLFFLSVVSNAQIPKAKPNTYIDDYTNHLSPDQLNDLNHQFRQLETNTGVQMAAILVNDLPQDITIEDYTRNIGNTWKVGTAHNGLVYVAVLNIRRQRLEVAGHLEGDIPDVTASEIIERLKDNLRAQDYFGALSLLVTQVGNHLDTQILTSSPVPDTATVLFKPATDPSIYETDFNKEQAKHNKYGDIGLLIILTGVVVFSVWAYQYRKKYIAMYTANVKYTGIGSSYYTGPGIDDSDSGAGFGGFGGGGGGGFGGGGASGGW